MNKLQTLLSEEIQNELEKLKDLEVGSDEYKTAVDGIAKLTGQLNDMEKIQSDAIDKKETRFNESTFRSMQLADEKRDRIIRNGLSLLGIVIPVGVTIWGTLKTLQFEKEGTVTTIMGRGFVNKLLPRK